MNQGFAARVEVSCVTVGCDSTQPTVLRAAAPYDRRLNSSVTPWAVTPLGGLMQSAHNSWLQHNSKPLTRASTAAMIAGEVKCNQ